MENLYNVIPGENGWLCIELQPRRREFWLDGYPEIENATEQLLYDQDISALRSPIYGAGHGGGMGITQWINYSLDCAVFLVPVGTWKT